MSLIKKLEAAIVKKHVVFKNGREIMYDFYDIAKANEIIEKELKTVYDALEALYDVQNGPPLVRYEKEWNEAMKLAGSVIKKATEAASD